MSKVTIEYSVVSRGTEKYNNCGYIAISKMINSYRYILNVDHGIKETFIDDNYLKARSSYKIDNIIFSRFQLITALTFNKHKKEINDNILILGLGNIGISCLIHLLDNNYKDISIYVKHKNKKMNKLLKIIEENYSIKINIVTELDSKVKYKTYIDTTGDSLVLKNVFIHADFNNTIIILSTPRDDKYFISPLIINRKNLIIIGGHELNGIGNQYRQNTFKKLLKINESKVFIKDFINIYPYSLKRLENIKKKKSNFIEAFKY